MSADPKSVRHALAHDLAGARDLLRSGQSEDALAHEVRSRLKKARAALRLLRPSLGKAWYRRARGTATRLYRPPAARIA